MSDVTLVIDELEIEGVPAAHRFDVAAGLSEELTRLITELGVPASLAAGEPPRIAEAVDHTASPHALGAAVARAIYGGWS